MKTPAQRSTLLFGVMLVVCALAPSLASAASWSPIGTIHQLTSTNLALTTHTSPLGVAIGRSCSLSQLDADVVSASRVQITAGRFQNCIGLDAGNTCTETLASTNLPWAATPVATDNIQIHGVVADVLFENTPGRGPCPVLGAKALLTGTVTAGSWDPITNRVELVTETGVTLYFLGTGQLSSTTVSGTLGDPAGTLRVFM